MFRIFHRFALKLITHYFHQQLALLAFNSFILGTRMQSTLGVIDLNGFYIIKRLAVANQYENTNMGNLV